LTSIGASSCFAGHVFVIQPRKRCLNGRVVPGFERARNTSSTAASTSSAGSTTLSTNPIAFAADADSVRPVSIMSIAAGAPTSFGRRTLPPQPG
jgi:hypothetical protein